VSVAATSPISLSSRADTAYRKGDFRTAIALQREEVAHLSQNSRDVVMAKKLLSLYAYGAGDYELALENLESLRSAFPQDSEIIENIGVILRLLGRSEDAAKALLEAHRLGPVRPNVCDALAHTFVSLGDAESVQKFGRLALELKDAGASKSKPLVSIPDTPPPPFSFDDKKRNIISFSLWGDQLQYLQGALRNAALAADLYPGWTCRFYCDDSVPSAMIRQLQAFGVEIVRRPTPKSFYDGLLWRFEVAADPGIARFLVRDCDAVINVRERVAVDEWLDSDKWFHTMRDYPSHTEVILAGMWGGVGGVLPSIETLRENFNPTNPPTRTYDQALLRSCVWPVVRQSVLSHDSVYTGCIGSVPFPKMGKLPAGQHVGQNEAAARPSTQVGLDESKLAKKQKLFVVSGIDPDAVAHLEVLVGRLEGVQFISGPGLSELREQARTFSDSLSAADDDIALVDDILISSLKSKLRSPDFRDASHVGVRERAGDVALLERLESVMEFKILCVIRDPRDTASSRRLAEVETAWELARTWVANLKQIARTNYRIPGAIEIVRYEDLSNENVRPTLRRIAKFLRAGRVSREGLPESAIDTGKPLPDELAEVIEATAGEMLEKLKYLAPVRA